MSPQSKHFSWASRDERLIIELQTGHEIEICPQHTVIWRNRKKAARNAFGKRIPNEEFIISTILKENGASVRIITGPLSPVRKSISQGILAIAASFALLRPLRYCQGAFPRLRSQYPGKGYADCPRWSPHCWSGKYRRESSSFRQNHSFPKKC